MTQGRLRVYLGAAPGVGKTFAMLNEAHRRADRGADVVVGLVETHNRPNTVAQLEGLEIVPRKMMEYRGGEFSEMDTDAILARRPELAIVDELAHTNIPGSRNEKRWEDIDELLAAGIDVITTVNIQHLESLNDTVEAITGIKQRETVPDAVVRAADQIELVDMSPQALRRRLAHGNVYAADKVDAALGNYFREGNLAALRELALLWLADRVDEGLEKYREDHGIKESWPARQRVVVAVTGEESDDQLLRRAAIVAGRGGRDLVAVNVIRGDGSLGPNAAALAEQRSLTEELGGSFHSVVGDDVAQTILEFARSVNGTRIVIGQSRRSRWAMLVKPSTASQVVRDSGEIDVQVVTHSDEVAARHAAAGKRQRHLPHGRKLLGILLAVVLPIAVTLVLIPFEEALEFALVMLLMLMAVVACSLVGGMLPAVISALWAAALTNWFFAPPLHTFNVSSASNIASLIMFLFVGITIALIVDRSAALAREASLRRAEADALTSLSMHVLSRGGSSVQRLLELIESSFGMTDAKLLSDGSADEDRRDAADALIDAGPGLTLAVTGHVPTNSERRILQAYAAQASAFIERDRLAQQAANALRDAEAESARAKVLASVTDDLQLLRAMPNASSRLGFLTDNLLALSRLQSGALVIDIEAVALAGLIDEVIEKTHAPNVDAEIAADLPLVHVDPYMLERILGNLIDHALISTPADEFVHVSADVIARHADRHLAIRVSGRGLELEEIEATPAGDNLSVTVARGFAERLGLTIEEESTPGGGVTTIVLLPV